MGGRVDLTSRNVLYYSLSRFSINLSLLPLSHLVSVSAGVTLESHSSAPSLLFPPHYSLFFYICISLSSPYFNVFLIFFFLFCVYSFSSLITVWNLCLDQPAGHLAVMAMASLQSGDDPWTPWFWPFSFFLLSAPALSLHTASLLFISEHQSQQGSSTGRK